jgi:hypothetical protein
MRLTCRRLFHKPMNIVFGTTKNRGHRDRDRIDVRQEHECRYWSEKLGVRADKIKDAVKAVGPLAKDVERYLRDDAEVARSA